MLVTRASASYGRPWHLPSPSRFGKWKGRFVISRTIGTVAFALTLLGTATTYSPQAQANAVEPFFVEYDLTINFIPGNPIFTDLTGGAGFSVPFGETGHLSIGGFDIGTLVPGNPVFTGRFIPSDPIIPGNPITPVSFSFSGHSDTTPSVFPIPPAFAYPDGVTVATLSELNGPPIMPLPIFEQQGPPIRVSGQIVAFDDPEVVGTWEITIQAETPLPAALPLFATGLGALGLIGWRRKKKVAALAA
jgi:hypothetical protein